MYEDAPQLSFRRATLADAELIFGWKNRADIVERGRNKIGVEWDQHVRWLQAVLEKSEEYLLLLILIGDEPVGQIRFDRKDRFCEVSIYLLSEFTGQGFGVEALRRACQTAHQSLGVDRIEATIRRDNPRSIRAFQKAGFQISSDATVEDDCVGMRKVIAEPESVNQ